MYPNLTFFVLNVTEYVLNMTEIYYDTTNKKIYMKV